MNLLGALRARASAERMGLDGYAGLVSGYYGGVWWGGIEQTLVLSGDDAVERSGATFAGLVHSAYSSNGVVFACMLADLYG